MVEPSSRHVEQPIDRQTRFRVVARRSWFRVTLVPQIEVTINVYVSSSVPTDSYKSWRDMTLEDLIFTGTMDSFL